MKFSPRQFLIVWILALAGLGLFLTCTQRAGRREDKIDLPFVDDPAVVGRWTSVDFVETINAFQPGPKSFQGDLYLKEMVFLPGGKTPHSWQTWTRGVVMHSGDRTASRYEIRRVGDTSYLFFEWKSGDYVLRGQTPKYYVLRRAP